MGALSACNVPADGNVTAVLAVQGAFAEHERMLDALGQPWFELRDADDLELPFARLILPGGESTTQGKLLRERGMLEPLRERVLAGMPVLATCAGLILLAQRVEGDGSRATTPRPDQVGPWLATLDVTVERNAYGRQLGSFHTTAPFDGLGQVPMSFIRAPYVSAVGPKSQVLARVDGRVVAVRPGSQLALAFHPELDGDPRIHELFLSL